MNTHAYAQSRPGIRPTAGDLLVQRQCACGGKAGNLSGECEDCRKKKLQRKPLAINAPGDRFEQEADRVADAVTAGSAAGLRLANPASPALQREGPAREKSNEDKRSEALKRVGEACLELPAVKQLLEQIKQDKLVRTSTDFLGSPPGLLIAGSAGAGVLAALAAHHKALPAQLPEIKTDWIRPGLAPGLGFQLTYEGPLDSPTSVMFSLKYAEQPALRPPGAPPASTATERTRAENARLAATDARFREGLRYPPGSSEDRQQKAEQAALRDTARRFSADPDLAAQVRQYPWLAGPPPRRGTELTLPQPTLTYRPRPPLLGEGLRLTPPGTPAAPERKREEAMLQRETTAPITVAGAETAPPSVHDTLERTGQPLDTPTRSWMEDRFGRDFSRVRIHTDEHAAESARSVNARAYTVGQDIVFDRGHFSPGTAEGRRLLAHELTHSLQQTKGGNDARMLSRTLHGPGFPTHCNCENWTIPLPPWAAGMVAHAQINLHFGIPPHIIPRATKAGGVLTGVPTPPAITPPGFADLWRNGPSVDMAEIKSSAIGGLVAANEARHYRLRHEEWRTRMTTGTNDHADDTYLAAVGGLRPGGLRPGGLLDLSSHTGSDLNLGPFAADLGKTLHVEADSAGAVVYWCEGPGVIGGPHWLPALRRLLSALKDKLDAAKRALEEAAVELARLIAAAARALLPILRVILAILIILAIVALVVVAFLCILGIPVTLGGSSVCTVAAVGAAASAAAALMVVIGLPSSGLPGATASVFRTLQPRSAEPASGADYERAVDSATARPTSLASAAQPNNPTREFASAIAPLARLLNSPVSSARSVASSVRNLSSDSVTTLNGALATLERSGDSSTAGFIRRTLQATGLNNPNALAQAGTDQGDEALAQAAPQGAPEAPASSPIASSSPTEATS